MRLKIPCVPVAGGSLCGCNVDFVPQPGSLGRPWKACNAFYKRLAFCNAKFCVAMQNSESVNASPFWPYATTCVISTEGCKIIKNRKPNIASELPSARGRRFAQPIAYQFTHLSRYLDCVIFLHLGNAG